MGGQGSGGSVSNANAGVPVSSRKVVQILKEIVNCSELEIYSMLVECNMDPDETISRLLSQDTFHEVKSKRDKKKEMKDPAESWKCNILNRRARSSYKEGYNTARGSGNRFNSSEMGSSQGVHVNKRENGTHNYWAGTCVLGCQPPPNSDPTNVEIKKAVPTGSSEAVTSSLLQIPTSQSAWVNANPRQRTMADIVKMGRPLHQKNVVMPRPLETQENGSKVALKDEWPSLLKQSADSKTPINQFTEPKHLGETHLVDEVPETKTNPIVSSPDADRVPPTLVSNKNLRDNGYSRDSSLDKEKKNKGEGHALVENGGEGVSAYVVTGFQKLTTENEKEYEILPKEDKPLVIIHNHIQVHTSPMFDSFGLGLGSGKVSSGLNDNLEETKEIEDNLLFRHLETDFYEEEEEKIRNTATRNYHAALGSETEAAQHKPPPQAGHQYNSSCVDYGFENIQQLNPPSETNPQMQNLVNFPNIMQQGYTGSLPNNLLPSGIQDVREPDLHYSPFPAIYSNATPSSFSDSEISMAEALRAASIYTQNVMPDAGQQAIPLTQNLALNPYSHHLGMPLWHYGNFRRYPSMSHSYNPYMPSAFQQAFSTDNYQSMLPQYENQATPSPVALPFAYGFDGGAASSNNFPLNPTSTPKEVLSSQINEGNHLASSLQQKNENLAVGHQGQQPNLSIISENGYYSLSDHQNQQLPGLCQIQLLQQPR